MSYRILLLEDDAEDVLLVRDLLEQARASFDVEWVAGAAAARASLAEVGEFDACLVDQRLGEASTGIDVIRWARDNGIRTPMIVLTGYAAGDVDMEGLEAGASGFVAKDQMTADLLERTILYAIGPSAASGEGVDEVAIATDLARGVATSEVEKRHGIAADTLARLRHEPRFAELVADRKARLTREAIGDVARSLRP